MKVMSDDMVITKISGTERLPLAFDLLVHIFFFVLVKSIFVCALTYPEFRIQEQGEENNDGWETVGRKPRRRPQKVRHYSFSVF